MWCGDHRQVQTSVVRLARAMALSAACVACATALSACTGSGGSPTRGGTVAVLAPVHPVSAKVLAADVAVVSKRLEVIGQSSDTASVRGTTVVVTGARLKVPAADLARSGHLYLRTVLCGAPAYQPPVNGTSPPSGPLPACGVYATTAAHLSVQANTQQPADNIPPDPALAPYRSTQSDDPNQTVLLGADPAAGPQQYPRFVLARASNRTATAIASASATFDRSIDQWAVSYTLTSSGSRAWDQVAGTNFHQFVAFDLDGLVETAPLIQPAESVFTSFGGRGEISGSFTAVSARALAAALASGPWAAPLHAVTVRP